MVARLAGTELVSAFCGFAPGFAYLCGLPAELAVPRLDSPRTAVPAGSVAVADTLVRGLPDRLAGRVAAARPDRRVTLWDADPGRARRCWRPGTRVRLVPA